MNHEPLPLEALAVPTFARLTDYLGAWCVEPSAFSGLWHFARDMRLTEHIARAVAEPVELRSAVERVAMPNGQTVATLRIQGLMMKGKSSFGGTSTVQARRDLRQAAADSDVGGIMLLIESPGGTVAGTDDLAADVKAAAKVKPVWAHVEDLGASAAYWVASQASRITANSPTALIGSIGVVQVIQDMSGAAEKAGVRTLVFATGPLKGLGAPGAKVTDQQATHVQGLVNAVMGSFGAAVQKGRKLTSAELAAVTHGGVVTAPAAIDAKLIDAIQPLSKTLAEFSKEIAGGSGGKGKQRAETPGDFDAGQRSDVVLLPTIQHSGLPLKE